MSLLTAAVIALGAWVLMVDRAVASQGTMNEAIIQRLDNIQGDIREVRNYLFRNAKQ